MGRVTKDDIREIRKKILYSFRSEVKIYVYFTLSCWHYKMMFSLIGSIYDENWDTCVFNYNFFITFKREDKCMLYGSSVTTRTTGFVMMMSYTFWGAIIKKSFLGHNKLYNESSLNCPQVVKRLCLRNIIVEHEPNYCRHVLPIQDYQIN